MSKPRSLVTGSCGFIGTHVVEDLVQAGHEVIATDLASAWENDDRHAGRFPGVLKRLGVSFKPGDIRDPGDMAAVAGDLDYVFHVASVFNYSTPWEVYRAVNVGGTRNLLTQVHERSPKLKRFVLWGAGGVYGLPQYQEGPFTEDMPPAPANDYLRSKWFQEHLTMRFCDENGISYSIVRPTTVYGPRQVYGFGRLLMDNAKSNPVVIPACLTGHIPMVHVTDVSGAAVYLATSPQGQGVFNVNDDTVINSVQLMELIAQWAGHRCMPIPLLTPRLFTRVATTAADVFDMIASIIPAFKSPIERPTLDYLTADFYYDNSKLKATGYEFRYPEARVGVKDTLDWYKQEGWI